MKMGRVASRAIVVLFLLALVAGFASAEPIDGPTVLKKMLEAEGSAAFTAYQVTTLARGPSLTSEQIVYRAGFSGMRTEYMEPPRLKGEISADDGRVAAHLIPRAKVLRIGPSRLAALKMRTEQAALAFRRGNMKVELVGSDKIAGRNAYVIQVKPRLRAKGPTRKFWVDSEKWIKLKTEDIAPDGATASMSYYTRIDFVNTIPHEKFRLEPPPGFRVERQAPADLVPIDKAQESAGFRVLAPTYLPPGFKLVGAAVQSFRRGRLVVIRYTDGVSSFSLFETPERVLKPRFLARLHEGPVRPRKGIYSWQVGNLNLTIVGQLPIDQIRKVASSVK
ncbi:MAG TPA: MucB/RseB C-terminal domain-containing protein [Armatimonadota bacterium]|nr:MucB/RseB C-terminal domain-containing protein [Armatimonadota bacterium]